MWQNDSIDNYRKDFLRIFKTREECERYLEIQKAFKKEFKKFKPDWRKSTQHKWFLYYDYSNEKTTISLCYSLRYPNVDYFKSEKVLTELIERFGEEDIKKYYLGIEE